MATALASYRLAAWIGIPPDGERRLRAIEARLLPLVLAELRRDLASQQAHNRSFYYRNTHGYWFEHEAEYREVAEEVLTEFPDSPRTHVYVAQYLYHGLAAVDRAIEVMFAAHKRGLLDDSGIEQLITFLFDQSRYAESIALLEPLIDRRPDEMPLPDAADDRLLPHQTGRTTGRPDPADGRAFPFRWDVGRNTTSPYLRRDVSTSATTSRRPDTTRKRSTSVKEQPPTEGLATARFPPTTPRPLQPIPS